MCVWVYDGSFQGLMSLIYRWFYSKEKPLGIQAADQEEPSLIDEHIWIETNLEWAEKATKGIVQRLGEENFKRLAKVYFSETEGMELCILKFLKLGFKIGPKVIEHLAEPSVADFYKRESAVARESHKMLGLIRFQELENGWLYAVCDSTYNQLVLLSPHFSERIGTEKWIIHDIKRGIASVFNGTSWRIIPLIDLEGIGFTESEYAFQDLWRRYYKHIGIEARKNEKLRMQMMPKKYWRYLSELEPERVFQ